MIKVVHVKVVHVKVKQSKSFCFLGSHGLTGCIPIRMADRNLPYHETIEVNKQLLPINMVSA